MESGLEIDTIIMHDASQQVLAIVFKAFEICFNFQVYPSALRAQKYRQVLKEKRLKSAPQPGKRKPLSFDEIMDKQTASWQTEYRGHFVGYETKNYQRSVCSRIQNRKSVDF